MSSTSERLSSVLQDTKASVDGKEKCFPTLLAVGIVIPIVIWILFYFIKPSFVQKKTDSGTYQRDMKKVFLWTFIITLILWVCLYLWTYCDGYDKFAVLCSRK
jgi:heme/copper-type cytochrome/quinol oxidase subunit 2